MPRAAFSTRAGRRIAGRAQDDHILDPYHTQQKLSEPSVCDGCGAVYRQARWQWAQRPEEAHQVRCPACRRIAENFPAGIVSLHGAFAAQHKAEIVGLARNEEAAETGEHPLNRIIGVNETTDGLEIQTTDIHLPRRIGTAIKRAYDGEIAIQFDKAGYFVRVEWRRPE